MTELLNNRVAWNVENGVARITLSRPEQGNALDMAMATAVRDAVNRVQQGAAAGAIRVAVLAGEGKTFCVGGDLREFSAAEQRGRKVAEVADELHAAIEALRALTIPVVSVVHGAVAGGGLGLALAADLVLVSEDAKMRLAYTSVGLTPDCGTTWVLSQRLGLARALDLALTNRVVTAGEAAQGGLISRAVPAAKLAAESEAVITALANGPVEVFTETKRLMAAAREASLADQLRDESATISRIIETPDSREGMAAFLEKRPARFR